MDEITNGKFENRRQEDFSKYNGMVVDVLSRSGKVQFPAKLRISDVNQAELIFSPPKYLKNGPYHVWLRGYYREEAREVNLEGSVKRIQDNRWRLYDLRSYENEVEREFFRLNVYLDASVVLLRGRPFQSSCTLLNISAGGACIETQVKFWAGDYIQLSIPRLTEYGIPPLHCKIRNSRKGGLPHSYRYGCEFINLNAVQQDRVMRAVFTLSQKFNKKESEI